MTRCSCCATWWTTSAGGARSRSTSTGAAGELRRSIEELKPSLIVLDSISSIAHSTSTRGFRQFMVGFASLVREHSRSALMTQATNPTGDDLSAPFLSTITDTIIGLDYKRPETRLERTIAVVKMRGSPHVEEAYSLSIKPGGLEVTPPGRRADGA